MKIFLVRQKAWLQVEGEAEWRAARQQQQRCEGRRVPEPQWHRSGIRGGERGGGADGTLSAIAATRLNNDCTSCCCHAALGSLGAGDRHSFAAAAAATAAAVVVEWRCVLCS